MSLDWLAPDEYTYTDPAPIAVLVPGLTGSAESVYIQRTAVGLAARGYRVACYNPRGRGRNELKTPFLYSAGYTEDLRRAVKAIRKEHPGAAVVAAGFSLGANYLAKYFGEEGARCKLSAGMSLACPADCISMSNNLLHTTLGQLCDKLLIGGCKVMLNEIEAVVKLHPQIDLETVNDAATMADFDDAAIAPMMGCSSASDYYRESSSAPWIQYIKRPYMFVSSRNDPIAPAHLIRQDIFQGTKAKNPEDPPLPVLLAITQEGGHSMLWNEGWDAKQSWSLHAVADFFDAALAVERKSGGNGGNGGNGGSHDAGQGAASRRSVV